MPPLHGRYPYGLTWDQLEPDPGDLAATPLQALSELDLVAHSARSLSQCSEEMDRVLDAALALAGRMLTQSEFSGWGRGRILAVALSTAVTWERG